MNSKYVNLFSPMKIGTLEVKNRFIIAPMEGTNIIDWLISCKYKSEVYDYYMERAKDGAGLIIPGMIPMRSLIHDKWLPDHPEVFKKVPALMDEIHSYGTKVFFQLGAGWGRSFTLGTGMAKMIDNKFMGLLAKPFINLDHHLVAPDEGAPNAWMPDYKCRAISIDEIHQLVQAYAKVALWCKNAGVDGVEVHAVHEGYLMDQFTTPYTNHRTDEYGGSFENRYRFAVEVVQAIKKVCGDDYPVSLRYSVTSKTKGFNEGAVPEEDFIEVGRTLEESEKAIKYLEEAGYDCFNCDNGTYDAWYWAHPPVYMPLNCNINEAVHIKSFTSKPIFCAGRMQLDKAEKVIGKGELDAVTIGRQFLCEEEYITKIRENRMEDIRPCISCHSGCLPVARFKGVGAEVDNKEAADKRMCALNPRTFNEKKYTAVLAQRPKNIAIVGGGIAGMEFAMQAAKRGHTVTLYEKSDSLGGVFQAAAAPSFKEKDKDLLDWYINQLQKSPVKIILNSEVKNISELIADEIVVATGGTARKLRAPGSERCIDATDFLLGNKIVGDSVAVIGGGLTGCEIAYELVLSGKHPYIIEMMDDLIKVMGVNAANSGCLRDLLRFHGVPVYLESKTVEIRESSVVIEMKEGEKEISADSVITSIGYVPNTTLVQKGMKRLPIMKN